MMVQVALAHLCPLTYHNQTKRSRGTAFRTQMGLYLFSLQW